MNSTPYKKSWLTHTRIARLMLETKLNSRIPTIREYAIIFDCASGVIQNALKGLEQAGAIELDKRGKNGTFLVRKDEEKLFDNAGLHFITGYEQLHRTLYLCFCPGLEKPRGSNAA